MINKNHVAQIRTCQRIKFDQALYILTMYQKKIRSQIKYDPNHPIIDADKQYDEKIIRSWNQKWKMDLTKPLLNCVTSVYPRIILDIPNQQQTQQMNNQNQILRYNTTMLQFIRRMRVQHEDQSNYKFIQIDINQKNIKMQRYKTFAAKSCKQYCNTMINILNGMKNSIQQNAQVELEQDQGNNFYLQIGSRIQDMLEVIQDTMENYLNQKLHKIISYNVSIFDSLKESQFGSTLVTIQPQLQQFTYLLHPLFLSIYALFLKQQDQQKIKMDSRQKKQPQDPNFPFKNFFNSNTTSLSKIVFVNLDGYQSQFNLQFARCFRRNLLYISFPKQDIHYSNDMNSVYEQRLYKKIMYNWQKNKMRFNNQSMDDQLSHADKMYFLIHNIQNYFTNVQNNLYNNNTHDDINRNMYMFPLRLNTLNQNFNNLIPQDQNDTIEIYESYAILQIFKYYLINQIKQFSPTYIVISHSGRLNIQDNHFVQIMQQLTKLCHYKLILFPNLTTRFNTEKNHIDHQINLNGIDYLLRKQQQMNMEVQNKLLANISFDFFNKISRFLKVSSGTHSLVKNFQEEDTVSKHRNLKVLKRVNKLMQVLGNQYQNIQRIRFKNSQIDLIPKLYEKDTQKIMKAFDKLIPGFYNQLYLLLQSIISICYLSTIDPKCLTILTKYNIQPQRIKNNYIIKQLIYFMQSKIIVRNARNEADKQLLSFEKIKKFLNCQRQKHFLQISQQKYEDSVLIYFKIMSNKQIYDNVVQGKPNFNGLIDLSFANPNKEIKDCMHIYDTTQILYKLDQTNGTGPIPILITNHLPLQRKSISKFDNYCAFLNRQVLNKLTNQKNTDQGIQKIYQQKKLKTYLIKLFDQQNNQIIENRFQFRTQWNYCQTQNYMVLYWPTMFNFLQAVAYKLQGRTYEPVLLNQFFIAKKEVTGDSVCFYKANVTEDLMPRTGCSTYQFKDFIYILGGFYDRQNNYLSLQRDITVLNLSMYTHDNHRKLQATNLKNQLYESITKSKSDQNSINSYVRPRRQFQFFDMQDLGIQNQNQIQQGYKYVIMIGGVGQNFIHPFSLLTYYYYVLKIDTNNGKLQSIKRNIVYNRSIPVNIRKPSKNMGIIKTPIRSKNQSNGKAISTKPQLTQPYSYARFRIVYKIQDGQLKYKFQYVFSEKDCKIMKQQLRKYQQQSNDDQLVSFRIQKIQGTNHQFIVQKFGTKQVVHLRLQTLQSIHEQRQQQVKLTHDSVTHMNIINGNYIFAIIKHANFTNGRSILADCFVKNIQNQNQSQDQASYVCLRPFYTDIKFDISLHIIQASNMNLIYILHGHRLYASDKLYQFQITHNKNKKTKIVTQIKPKKQIPQLMDKSNPICCYSTFYYKRTEQKNQILCQSYINFQEDKNVITRINQYFDPADVNNLCWNMRYPIMRYVFCLEKSNVPISLQRTTFLEFYRQEKIRIIVLEYNKKKYMAKILEYQLESVQCARIELELASDLLINNLEQNQFEKGTILIKKLENYEDRGYIPSQ